MSNHDEGGGGGRVKIFSFDNILEWGVGFSAHVSRYRPSGHMTRHR